MNIHPNVLNAFQEIDSALFSGDSFHNLSNLKELKKFLFRWEKRKNEIIDSILTEMEENKNKPFQCYVCETHFETESDSNNCCQDD